MMPKRLCVYQGEKKEKVMEVIQCVELVELLDRIWPWVIGVAVFWCITR